MRTPIDKVVQKLLASAKGFVDSLSVSEEELYDELCQYETFIAPHFAYFNELDPQGKARFLQRVYNFKKKKTFHYERVLAEPKMPVLISACAVQITFGLRKYRMPYFTDIYIMPDSYTYGLNKQQWLGHVNRTGIYLSWKHFIQGYSVHGDRFNVGLHEMAHALEYVNFLGTFGRDRDFAERFVQYKKKAEMLLPTLKMNCKLFTEQAAHNYHECWAESVELFFENPLELREHYPVIYDDIKQLLNQDPANKIKMVEADDVI